MNWVPLVGVSSCIGLEEGYTERNPLEPRRIRDDRSVIALARSAVADSIGASSFEIVERPKRRWRHPQSGRTHCIVGASID
ncbi:hypothetical protein C489_19561 [Natrinema versiforme JCM 10478]|uniref:Uncharacterized protein n=1 Tax=Natrinema versiforme JCM 10478 TaxID=1227496 RepID=L9XPD4_9EURY|nr:hypothetical protein C489_19561 [Natrinema versiforme JCM 10478]